jgi:hypothetical protein
MVDENRPGRITGIIAGQEKRGQARAPMAPAGLEDRQGSNPRRHANLIPVEAA